MIEYATKGDLKVLHQKMNVMEVTVEKIDHRVGSLEDVLRQFIVNTDFNYKRMLRSQEQLHAEMQDFKDEMKVFKEEMKVFKDESVLFREQSKQEMSAMKKEWGNLSNRLGTLVEDFVLPNIPNIFLELTGQKPTDVSARRKVSHPTIKSKEREFDAVASSDHYLLINSTKSRPDSKDVKAFENALQEIFDYFPKHIGKTLIPVFASLYIPKDLVKFLSKRKIYALALEDDTMQILNPGWKVVK